MSVPKLDFIGDMDVVGEVPAFGGQKPTEEEWVALVEHHLGIYLRCFARDASDRSWTATAAWEHLVYEPDEKWDEFDLRWKFIQFCEMYPVAKGSGYSETGKLNMSGVFEGDYKSKWAKAALHDYLYGFTVYKRMKMWV